MGQVFQTLQVRMKKSSGSFLSFAVRIISGLVIGLTLALIGQEILGYGNFSFTFVIVVVSGLFMRKSRHWSMGGVLIFDLVCVLIGLLLKMYIQVAPGA